MFVATSTRANKRNYQMIPQSDGYERITQRVSAAALQRRSFILLPVVRGMTTRRHAAKYH